MSSCIFPKMHTHVRLLVNIYSKRAVRRSMWGAAGPRPVAGRVARAAAGGRQRRRRGVRVRQYVASVAHGRTVVVVHVAPPLPPPPRTESSAAGCAPLSILTFGNARRVLFSPQPSLFLIVARDCINRLSWCARLWLCTRSQCLH